MNGHSEVLLAILAGVAWMFAGLRRAVKGRAARDAGPAPAAGGESESERRTREVREEVLRRIAERRRGIAGPVVRGGGSGRPPASSVLAPRPVAEGLPGFPPRRPEASEAGWPAFDGPPPPLPEPLPEARPPPIRPAPARQATRSAPRAPSAPVAAPFPAAAMASPAEGSSNRGGPEIAAFPSASGPLLAELRDPATARRAILIREILGAPVALR